MENQKNTKTWVKVVCIILSALMIGSVAYVAFSMILGTLSNSTATLPAVPAITESADL